MGGQTEQEEAASPGDGPSVRQCLQSNPSERSPAPPRLTEKLDGAGATGEEVCRTMREPEKDRSIGDTKENYGGTRHNNTPGRACTCISCKFKV